MNISEKIQPVLIGGDINAYSVARAFHEEYGVVSIAIAKMKLGATNHSRIIDFYIDEDLTDEEHFIDSMIELGNDLKEEGKTPILIGTKDDYVDLIIKTKDKLKDIFVIPYIDEDLKEKLMNKEEFYKLCDEMGVDYPKTHILSKDMEIDDFSLMYPIIIKPSNPVLFWSDRFEGMEKVYIVKNKKEFIKVVRLIYSTYYDDNLIIQEYIEGDDTNIWTPTFYSDRDNKVKMMAMGHVLLEEHVPTAIGNDAAIIMEYKEEPLEKIKTFLEKIGFTGFANCDMKYDKRDGKYKIFEVNVRQGRSNYSVTASCANIAKLLVEERVMMKDIPLVKQSKEIYWHLIANSIVLKYVKDEEIKEKVRKLIEEKKDVHTFDYVYDLKDNMKRSIYIMLYKVNHILKYKKYMEN